MHTMMRVVLRPPAGRRIASIVEDERERTTSFIDMRHNYSVRPLRSGDSRGIATHISSRTPISIHKREPAAAADGCALSSGGHLYVGSWGHHYVLPHWSELSDLDRTEVAFGQICCSSAHFRVSCRGSRTPARSRARELEGPPTKNRGRRGGQRETLAAV